MRKRIGMICVLALAFIAGLLLPDAMLRGLDARFLDREWPIADTEVEYRYEGTLENRVRALETWQSGAALGIRQVMTAAKNDSQAARDAPKVLYDAGLLPVDLTGASVAVSAFQLISPAIGAEYEYLDIACETDDCALRAIQDRESGAYLRIEFTGPPALMTDWMKETGEGFYTQAKSEQLMTGYASLLGYERLSDLNGNYINGDAIQGFDSDIEGTMFVVSVKYAVRQGLLLYKLSAKPSL